MGLENRLSQLTAVEWGKLLKRVRQHTDHSQLEASEMLNVGFTTYQKWEQGRRKPRPVYRRKIREVFNDAFLALESTRSESEHAQDEVMPVSDGQEILTANTFTTVALSLPEQPEHKENGVIVVSSQADLDPINTFITGNMTMHLLNLVYTNHFSHSERQSTILQAIKDFDTMNTTNKSYHMTRRDALSTLATLPAVTLGMKPGVTVQPIPTQYGTTLEHCSASLEACWQLSKSNIASDLALAFQCVSAYQPVLEAIAQTSSQHRVEALDLTAQCALVKTYLGWYCVGPAETIQYAKIALTLSKGVEDPSLLFSAYSKLAWAYFYNKQYVLALKTSQEAEFHLQQYNARSKQYPLPTCITGGIYSTLALMLAKNGKSPDEAIGQAIESDPGKDIHAFMDFKQSNLLLETGMAYCYYGDQAKAMETLEKRVDVNQLTPKIPQSERGRLETINIMALSSLKRKDRDLEKTVHLWVAGIEGAKSLNSEIGFNDSVAIYELMEFVWPEESRITELRDLTRHW